MNWVDICTFAETIIEDFSSKLRSSGSEGLTWGCMLIIPAIQESEEGLKFKASQAKVSKTPSQKQAAIVVPVSDTSYMGGRNSRITV
jgi:hypothetical protein